MWRPRGESPASSSPTCRTGAEPGIVTGARDCPVLIVGSGPAGWTAAIYAARAALQPVVVRGPQPGGQLTVTTDVENYPGFADIVQGPWLMEQMEAQARAVGVEILDDVVASIDLNRRPFVCASDNGARIRARAVILATGANARWLGLPSERQYRGHGVSACATCDGFFFRGKEVVVVGGGNTAAEEALFLTRFATKVTLVHRRDSLRADRILQDRLQAEPRIEIVWNHVVDAIQGDAGRPAVTGVRLRSTRNEGTRDLAAEGVFVAIGHDPNTALVRGQVETDEDGYIRTRPGSTATSIPGFFAAGDVQDRVFRQAVTAAGQGCMAALEAERFLAGTRPAQGR